MENKIIQVGNEIFVADADLHHDKTREIGERVAADTAIHSDGRKGMFINDEDMAYLLTACTVLLWLLSATEDETPEIDTDGIPDLPGRKDRTTSVH